MAKVEYSYLKWFGLMERMDEVKIIKDILKREG